MLLIIGTICLVLIFAELLPLYRSRQWAPFIINSVLLAFILAVSVMIEAGLKIPSINKPISSVINLIFNKK